VTTVAISYIGQTQTSGACPNAYTLTRRWTASDNCNNTRSISQRITVVDNGKPVFTSFPANATIACNEAPPPVGSPTASDGCGSATVTYLGQSTTVSGNCPGNYQIKRTWRATDACGNSTVATQTIQVSDTGAPVFTSVPGPITIECGDPLPPLVNPTANGCLRRIRGHHLPRQCALGQRLRGRLYRDAHLAGRGLVRQFGDDDAGDYGAGE
jgi:hypothetical protein